MRRLQGQWEEPHQLSPRRIARLGRSPANNIVLTDAKCSRNHCELFVDEGRWVVRDLGSRNGTFVNGRRVEKDAPLQSCDRIRLGGTVYWFAHDPEELFRLSEQAVSDETDPEQDVYDGTDSGILSTTGDDLDRIEILHRQSDDRLAEEADRLLSDGQMLAEMGKLYGFSLKLSDCDSVAEACDLALGFLQELIGADSGAVLLVSDPDRPDGTRSRVAASFANTAPFGDASALEDDHDRYSAQVSQIVLNRREGILAKDLRNDAQLVIRDSLGRLQAESLICAPLCLDAQVLGTVHLHRADRENPFDESNMLLAHVVSQYLAKNLNHVREKEKLRATKARIEEERDALLEELGENSELVGESPPMRRLKESIARIAPTDATVLVRGESGVGKELVARATHKGSPRKGKPFVTMNCAALSETLLESELFGHEKGSFTGATDRKFGKFEQAHEGTIFLDEVGEMGPTIQAKFLRVLERHPFERVGGREQIEVDVRVVAATNRDLEKMVKEGRFRADLYFRLNVVQIIIDPLRKRRDDIPRLANHFLQKVARKLGRNVIGFHPDALAMLTQHNWPGNVRELQNTVERTVILSQGEYVTTSDIQFSPVLVRDDSLDELDAAADNSAAKAPSVPPAPENSGGFREISIKDLEREHILAALEHTEWNKSRAAAILGIERSTLDRKLSKYRVSRPEE